MLAFRMPVAMMVRPATEFPQRKRARAIVSGADLLDIIDECAVDQLSVVGHDWGAVIAWGLVEQIGERATCFVPMSVCPPQCYAGCDDFRQKEIGWYTLMFQMEVVAEQMLTADDWKLFRQWTRHHDETACWIADLSREGRLTAAMGIYRANVFKLLTGAFQYGAIVPTLGLWSSGDDHLVEEQMVAAGRHVKADWRYERVADAGHWMILDRTDHINRLLLNFIGQHQLPG